MIVYFELKTIEKELGFPLKTLFALSNNLDKHYVHKEIKKKNGGVRRLLVPDLILKRVQKSILNNILMQYPVSKYAKAYFPGNSVKDNASVHVNKKKILKLDILHFFDDIYYSLVKDKVFVKERFSEPIRILLTMLCYHDDRLPQGAPTSPMITNIIMRDFDYKIGKWSEKHNIDYTRYCDDMTFSGDFDEKIIINQVKNELKKINLLLNTSKTKVIYSSSRQIVTGVVVNEKLNVPLDYRKKIRQEMYYINKFGLESHMSNNQMTVSKKEYLNSLLGRISFSYDINMNKEMLKYKKEIIELLKGENNYGTQKISNP